MQNSPTAAYLSECSLHERIMLAALIKCIKREGIEEIKWNAVGPSSMWSLQLDANCTSLHYDSVPARTDSYTTNILTTYLPSHPAQILPVGSRRVN
jgi:hypothetical protein